MHTQDFPTTGPQTTTATHTVPQERRTATLKQLSPPSPHPTLPLTPQMQPQTTTKQNPNPRNRKLNHHYPTRLSSPRPPMKPRPSPTVTHQNPHVTYLFSPIRSLPITTTLSLTTPPHDASPPSPAITPPKYIIKWYNYYVNNCLVTGLIYQGNTVVVDLTTCCLIGRLVKWGL